MAAILMFRLSRVRASKRSRAMPVTVAPKKNARLRSPAPQRSSRPDLISDALPFGRLWYRERNRLREVSQPLTRCRKSALQLLEDHTRFMKRFYGNRTNPSSQAPPNFYVGLRLTRERCGDSRLRCSGHRDRNARKQGRFQRVVVHFFASGQTCSMSAPLELISSSIWAAQ